MIRNVILILLLAVTFSDAAEPGMQTTGKLLFNGRDLAEWEVSQFGKDSDWSVVEGQIACRNTLTELSYRAVAMPEEFDFEFEWYCDDVDRDLPDHDVVIPLGSISMLFHRSPQQEGLTADGQPNYVRKARITYDFKLGSGNMMLATDNFRYDEPGDPHISQNFNVSRAANLSARKHYGVWHSGRIVWTKQRFQHWVDGKKVLDVGRRKLLDVSGPADPTAHDSRDVNLWDVSRNVAPRKLYLTIQGFNGAMRFRNLRLTVPSESSRSAKSGASGNIFSSPPLPR